MSTVDPCAKCAKGETCVDGKCVAPAAKCIPACTGGKVCVPDAAGGSPTCATPTCTMPKTWGPHIQKATSLNIASSGVGCDLNDDGKIDNAFSVLKDLVGSQLEQAVKDGVTVMLFDSADYKTDGMPFGVRFLNGAVDKSNPTCDFTKAGCKYTVHPSAFDQGTPGSGPCAPQVQFKNATVKGMELQASGQGMIFSLPPGRGARPTFLRTLSPRNPITF